MLAVALAFGVLWLLYQLILLPGKLRFRRRVQAVEQAAGDHPYFNAREVRQAAERIFRTLYEAWNAGDFERMRQIGSEGLFDDWLAAHAGDRAAGGRYRVEILRGPRIDYVGFGDHSGEDRDYATVRVRARLKQWLEQPDGSRRPLPQTNGSYKTDLHDYWTLSRRRGEWILFSIRPRAIGERDFLSEPIQPPEPERPAAFS